MSSPRIIYTDPTGAPLSKKGKALKIFFILCFLIIGVIETPSAIIFFFGMVPTFVALLTDDDPFQTALFTIGPMNLTGIIPMIAQLWKGDNSIHGAYIMLSQPISWLVMYGSATIGWCFYFIIPFIVAAFMIKKTEIEVSILEKKRDKLQKKWNFS